LQAKWYWYQRNFKIGFNYLPGKTNLFRELLKRSTKSEAGYYIQAIAACLARLQIIIAAGSHHSSITNAKVGKGLGELSYP
jgi:hypothetical protein